MAFPQRGDEVVAALEAFRPTGDVLELACGPGTWTPALLRHATTVTAVDAAPEMLAIASARVPLERFESFWSLVGDCLGPNGRVFFIDDGYRTPEELIEGERSSTIQRRLNDGTAFRAVKVAATPSDLEARLSRLGWRISVMPTSGPFFWGSGTAGGSSTHSIPSN